MAGQTPTLQIPYATSDDLVTAWPAASKDLAEKVEQRVLEALAQTQVAPVSTVQAFAGQTAPTGWLICNGAEYDQADYTALFAVIGQTYGGAAGKFKVPDLGGRVIVGVNGSYALNASGGATTHTLSVPEIPSHKHVYNLSYSTTGSTGGATGIPGTGTPPNTAFPTETEFIGGGGAHNNMQPYRALNYIIKT